MNVPLPSLLLGLIEANNLVIIVWDDLIQEFEKLLKLLKLPVLFLIKVLQLLLKLLSDRSLELCESIVGGSITERATLFWRINLSI